MRKLQLSTFPTLLVLLVSLAGCSMSDDTSADNPDERAAMVLDGVTYEIVTTAELSKDQLHAIAAFIEAQGEDVHQAKVKVHMDDDDGEDSPTLIELELWGNGLPGDELVSALQQEFPVLADAQISTVELDSAVHMQVEVGHGIEPGDDAATIKQKVEDDLHAQGVEGEIDVTVTPTDDGHHEIEVEVEVHEHD